jgi:hypothetical protein
MSSWRKHPQSHADAPVSTPPRAAEPASTQPPAPLPPEEIRTTSPADEAAQAEIVKRLTEVEYAQRHQREPEPLALAEPAQVEEEPQALTAEQIIETSGMSQPVKNWLRKHPELVTDPIQNARLQKMHFVAEYQAGEVDTPAYLDRLDVLLGYRPQPASQPRDAPAPTYSRASGNEPRPAPVVQQRRPAGPPVSAPPTREAPSMRTGHPVSKREPLTQEQRDMAKYSGISEEEYARQLEKMEKMRAVGQLQEGR